MTKSIDERIVEMQFNNKQFESGIGTSLKSIDKLKAGLNFDKAANSLSGLERAGHTFSLAGISDTLDAISNKFSALGIVGITVLQNITNAAINAGTNIVKALTIDPIKTGLEEYETKMNSITTILTNTASKGTTLDDVTKALDELNTYSDKTIYNFAEMTRNIGTFTAAGVGLDTSVTSIKGIANLAAGSGSSALQASTAMYQLSQAISTGTVKLIDWNSVVNAGMGGELFQKALEKTANELGHGRNMAVSFRDSLESGWLTTEVLTKTLEKFANDPALIKAATEVKTFTQLLNTMKESVQSGWAKSWEYIIGDKDKAAKFFTSINDGFNKIIGASADARNATLAFWNANGGRDAIIKALSNAFKGLQSILKPIGEAFREVFPAMTGQRLIEISKAIRDLTANFKIGDATAENLKNTFKGLFTILNTAKEILTNFAAGLFSVIKFFLPVGDSVLSLTGAVGSFIVALNEALTSSNAFTSFMKGIGRTMLPLAKGVRAAVVALVDALGNLAVIDMSGFETFLENTQIKIKPFEIFSKLISGLGKMFYNLANVIGKASENLRNFILASFNMANFDALYKAINNGLFAAILLSLKKFIDSLSGLSHKAGGILGGVTNTLDGVTGSLEALQSSLKANVLLKIAIAIGILAAGLLTISKIEPNKLKASLAAMAGMFVELFASMATFNLLMGKTGILAMFQITTAMIGMAIAVNILAKAMERVGKLDWNGVAKGLAALVGMSAVLILSSKMMATSSGMLIRTAIALTIFAVAMNVLSKSVEKLAALKAEDLAKGLIGIGVLLGELALFMRSQNLNSLGMVKAIGILIFAGALTVLADAVKKLSTIDIGDLIKSLTGMAIILSEIVVFTKTIGNPLVLTATAAALTVLGVALLLIAQAVTNLGNMSWEEMSRGLLVLAGALGAITIAFNLLPASMLLKSVAIIDVAGALTILTSTLIKLSKLSWEGIAKSLTILSVSLGLIIGMFVILKSSDLVDSTAFMIMAFGIKVLVKALISLGNLSLAQVGISLLALAGTFALIGGASILLAPLLPAILGLSAALVVFGVAVLAIGAGVLMLSTGLAALAVAGTGVSVALVAIVTSLAGLIPFVFKSLAQGITEFVTGLASNASAISKAVSTIVLAILNDLVKLIPGIVNAIGKLVVSTLDMLLKYIPKIVDTGMKLVIAFLKGVSEHITEVVAVAVELVANFIEGIAQGLPKLIQAGFDLIVAFITGLADAVEKNAPIVLAAIVKLMLAIPKAAVKTLLGGVKDLFGVGKNLVQGLINGIKSMISAVSGAVGGVAKSILAAAKRVLGIHSPSTVFKDEVGAQIGAGVAVGITESSKQAIAAATEMAKAVGYAGKDSYDKAVEWINNRKYYNQLTLQEELACWQELQYLYKQGCEERIKADKEVYRVEQEIRKAGYDASVKWIDNQKYYNKLSLMDELAAWERVQKRYLEGTDERAQADREIYRVQNEINNANEDYTKQSLQIQEDANNRRKDLQDEYYAKTQEINDKLISDIEGVNKAYDDAVKSRADSLYSSYGLFDRVEGQKNVSGAQLIRNLKGQVSAFEAWKANLDSLASKGLDEELIAELRAMGPSSASQIAALNKMTDEQLTTYVALWQTKHGDAKDEAVSELETMRIDTISQIRQLRSEAEQELEDYQTTWSENMAAVNADAATQLSALQTEWATKMGVLTTNTEAAVATMNTNVQTTVATMRVDTEKEFTTLAANIQAIMNTPDWSSIGVNIIEGVIQGIRAKTPALINQAAFAALMALKSAKDALGIQSPSKAFAEVGMYAVKGFVNGLSNVSTIVSSAKDVGKIAVNSLKGALSNAVDAVNGGLDLAPTIRPVLDLTNVEAGKKNLNALFGTTNGINVSGANSKASSITSGLKSTNATTLEKMAALISEATKVQDNRNGNGSSLSFEGLFKGASFNVRNDNDIKKIAKEVSQELFNLERTISRGRGLATT